MNIGAIELYADHGIDIRTELLEIAVCAQHCNGGVAVDENWQSDVSGLYVAGEAAGTFGVYRPGGSALNSTQVGSLRAAEHIAKKKEYVLSESVYTLPTIKYGKSNVSQIRNEMQTEMSRVADFDRSTECMRGLFDKVCGLCDDFFEVVTAKDNSELSELFWLYDMVLTQRSVLSAMLCSAEAVGTHGSAFVDRKPSCANRQPRSTRTLTKKSTSYTDDISPMPTPELWFEILLARKKQEMDNERK